MDKRKRLGRRLCEVRTSRRMSQDELAWRTNLKPYNISDFERGVVAPSNEMLVKICRVLQCSWQELHEQE